MYANDGWKNDDGLVVSRRKYVFTGSEVLSDAN